MKWCILFFGMFFTLVETNAQGNERMSKAETLVEHALDQLGMPYKWGTSNPFVSFDCSGFASYVYGTINVDAPRSSSAYALAGTEVTMDEARKGDCMVFTGTEEGSITPGHVGIIISNDEKGIHFIHCSSSKKHFGVVLTHYESSGYPKRFHSVRRLF